MTVKPPRWADRFLEWYCNPQLLEEIQGDAYELYAQRCKTESKFRADLKYVWDIIRFFRWTNIRRANHKNLGKSSWRLSFKISSRMAWKHKFIFATKTIGLSFSLSFSLLIFAYVLNEYSYDEFHVNADRIFRVTSKVNFTDKITHYAVTPLPIGKELNDHITGIDNYFRFMFEENAIYSVKDEVFHNERTLAADSAFLKILTFNFLEGNEDALNEPNTIVVTQSLAKKFFGDQPPIGQVITYRRNMPLTVSAVIGDLPVNSHLQFDALISWNTFDREDDWGNLNAYTYVLLKQDISINDIKSKTSLALKHFHDLVAREYNATFEPVFERITDIHFSPLLDEDIAIKKSKTNLLILSIVVVLFLVTGLVNYLNLTLAELTANMKRIGILRIFGAVAHGLDRIVLAEALITLVLVFLCSVVCCAAGLSAARHHLSLEINTDVFLTPIFLSVIILFFTIISCSGQVNVFLLSRGNQIFDLVKGKIIATRGISSRKFLVSLQLSFSIIMIALVFIVVDQFNFMQDVDKGFNDDNLMVIKLQSPERSTTSIFTERLRRLRGVSTVGVSSYFPGIVETKYVFKVETEKGMQEMLVPMIHCEYDYLDVLDVQMVAGRMFSKDHPSDEYSAFIVNETAAKQFGWNDAIGKRVAGPIGGQGEADRTGNVIGVVRDFNFATLHTKIEPLIICITNASWTSSFVYVKTDPLQANLQSSIQNEFNNLWPAQDFEWEYLDSKYTSLYEKDYDIKNIFEAGLFISILISSLSIFSMSALLTRLRNKEMGIRKIVGASSIQIFLLQLKSFIEFLVISVLLAWPLIWYLSDKWLINFAYHIPLSVFYFVLPACVALIIVVVTSAYHCIRASLINPGDIIKHE